MIWLYSSESAHEYKAGIDKPTAGRTCPAFKNRKLTPAEDDLGTRGSGVGSIDSNAVVAERDGCRDEPEVSRSPQCINRFRHI